MVRKNNSVILIKIIIGVIVFGTIICVGAISGEIIVRTFIAYFSVISFSATCISIVLDVIQIIMGVKTIAVDQNTPNTKKENYKWIKWGIILVVVIFFFRITYSFIIDVKDLRHKQHVISGITESTTVNIENATGVDSPFINVDTLTSDTCIIDSSSNTVISFHELDTISPGAKDEIRPLIADSVIQVKHIQYKPGNAGQSLNLWLRIKRFFFGLFDWVKGLFGDDDTNIWTGIKESIFNWLPDNNENSDTSRLATNSDVNSENTNKSNKKNKNSRGTKNINKQQTNSFSADDNDNTKEKDTGKKEKVITDRDSGSNTGNINKKKEEATDDYKDKKDDRQLNKNKSDNTDNNNTTVGKTGNTKTATEKNTSTGTLNNSKNSIALVYDSDTKYFLVHKTWKGNEKAYKDFIFEIIDSAKCLTNILSGGKIGYDTVCNYTFEDSKKIKVFLPDQSNSDFVVFKFNKTGDLAGKITIFKKDTPEQETKFEVISTK
jgi:hypothetical protein